MPLALLTITADLVAVTVAFVAAVGLVASGVSGAAGLVVMLLCAGIQWYQRVYIYILRTTHSQILTLQFSNPGCVRMTL